MEGWTSFRTYLVAREDLFNRVTKFCLWREVFHRPWLGPYYYSLVQAGRDNLAADWQDVNFIAAACVASQNFDERAISPIDYAQRFVQRPDY
jgi:hypothetical protein